MRRRLATLFVDIAGSTRLVVRHPPETMLGVVQCFAALVTDIALRHRGRVKDFEGDGVLLYFESAVDAADAALAIHAALDRERCEAGCGGGPGAPVRMSLTLGDVAVGAVGPKAHPALALVGPSVNLGARLLRVVPPGGIAASAEVVAALGTAPAIEQDIARREMSECVRDYIDQLPADYRTVVVLSELEELPDREIAEVLAISLEAAKIRLHRARARLRQMLEQGCDVSRDERNELTCEPRPDDVSSTD